MRVVIDTNVLVSGIFFKGPPGKILDLWRNKKITIIVSEAILTEYARVINEFSIKFKSNNLEKILNLILVNTELSKPVKVENQICADIDDDKFIECALSGKSGIIITGDKHLLSHNGLFGLEIIKPAKFIGKYFTFL